MLLQGLVKPPPMKQHVFSQGTIELSRAEMIRLADQLYHEATTVCTVLICTGWHRLTTGSGFQPLALQLLAVGDCCRRRCVPRARLDLLMLSARAGRWLVVSQEQNATVCAPPLRQAAASPFGNQHSRASAPTTATSVCSAPAPQPTTLSTLTPKPVSADSQP